MSDKRFPVLRDVIVFQVKLLVDGLRDLLLSPVSIIAALIDLLVPGDDGGKRFYGVVHFGRRTERWINLFGMADKHDPEAPPAGIDVLLADLEGLARDPARREEARARAQAIVERLRGGPRPPGGETGHRD
ncbi:MAG TPA: hypothetical protein PLI48_01220 [Gammaproteobacteria bacterium]|nr:hypothetical protein [Gammaproteobacteria bacterium]HRP86847.1 hypothetical protein [Gammaproteobacteria bacterium]